MWLSIFVALDYSKLPTRKILDERIASVWGKRFNIHVTFCTVVLQRVITYVL